MTSAAEKTQAPKPWPETPLIRSSHISNLLGCSAYLKLENLQPSQSYKYRGLSLFAQRCKEEHGPNVHLIIASGGNAGLAVAFAAHELDLRCTVYIPEGIDEGTIAFFKRVHAKLVIGGKFYLEALTGAQEALKRDDNAVMVPAYDDPLLWQGHSSMIEEIARDIPRKPDAIFCSVGGAGMLGGVLVGCKNVGWDDVAVNTVETHGSNCFYHSFSVNPGQFNSAKSLPPDIEAFHEETQDVNLARVNRITSRAVTLGATSPAPGVVKMALERPGTVKCVSVPDELTMQVAGLFADDHKMLVELACAATLCPAYKPTLFDHLVPPITNNDRVVVFIVCGGFRISLNDLVEYESIVKKELSSGSDGWDVVCNGEKVQVPK